MKTNALLSLLVIFFLAALPQLVFAQANTNLNNLTPTAINQSLIGQYHSLYDLGSSSLHWRDLYLNGVIKKGTVTVFDARTSSTAVGGDNLLSLSGGYDDVAFGLGALKSVTTGWGNAALGVSSLTSNTTGSRNTALGNVAMIQNTIGADNVALGYGALANNTSGIRSVAVGSYAGFTGSGSSSGFENVAIGYAASYFGGFGTISIGARALYNGSKGTANIAIGNDAMFNGSQGGFTNVAIGHNTLKNTSQASDNAVLGYASGELMTIGDGNTFMGNFSGQNCTTGNNNVAVGFNSGEASGASGNLNHTISLGSSARVTASNTARIGIPTTSSIGGYTGWSNLSDGRFKKNVRENVPGMAFIRALRPVTYTLDVRGLNRKLALPDSTLDREAIAFKESQINTGFIAQEVETAAQKIGYDFSGVDAPKNESDLYALRYAEFVVPLVKAVQELDQANEAVKAENARLKQEHLDMLRRLENLEKSLAERGNTQNESLSTTASLQQNSPNPFNQSTTIQLSVPQGAGTASLLVSAENGRLVKTFPIAAKGTVDIAIQAGTLEAGIYYYTLLVDGNKVDTKKMILTK